MSTLTSKRARVASLSRSRADNDPELIGARRSLKAARLEKYVTKTLAEAPPLTDEQRERIARLLHPSAHAQAGGRR